MNHEIELSFFLQLLKNYRIHYHVFNTDVDLNTSFDLELRKFIFKNFSYKETFDTNRAIIKENTIFHATDSFYCNYIIFSIPDSDTIVSIGPYNSVMITDSMIYDLMASYSLSSSSFSDLRRYYNNLKYIPNEENLLILINTFGGRLWNGMDNFSIEHIDQYLSANPETLTLRNTYDDSADALLSMKILEERYHFENQLMSFVSKGAIQSAEMLVSFDDDAAVEDRISDKIHNIKHYCIILNTLLRKAAEYGMVHPLHIDLLSANFAREIDAISSLEEAHKLRRKMVRKYCMLVKNHSLNGYSSYIRTVLTLIDADLTVDLSLRHLADILNINPSYLSTKFKKEVGCSLTDYINKKRIDHALYLCNSTTLQIQTIAQYCGITDVNYFSRLFKKYVGKSPLEYRKALSSHE